MIPIAQHVQTKPDWIELKLQCLNVSKLGEGLVNSFHSDRKQLRVCSENKQSATAGKLTLIDTICHFFQVFCPHAMLV